MYVFSSCDSNCVMLRMQLFQSFVLEYYDIKIPSYINMICENYYLFYKNTSFVMPKKILIKTCLSFNHWNNDEVIEKTDYKLHIFYE